MIVFLALVGKELKNLKWMNAVVNIASILIMISFIARITGWSSSLVLLVQVYMGYLFLRESFFADKQTKTIESLFATPVDGQSLWLTRVMVYGLSAVLFSLVAIFSIAAVINSFWIVSLWDFLFSPFTFILLGLAGIILWRIRQTYSDIVALVAISVTALVLMTVPFYAGIVLALCILAASWGLASDKESIILC